MQNQCNEHGVVDNNDNNNNINIEDDIYRITLNSIMHYNIYVSQLSAHIVSMYVCVCARIQLWAGVRPNIVQYCMVFASIRNRNTRWIKESYSLPLFCRVTELW